jgi:DNA-binding PadR family transcriptional regulator
MVQAHRQPRQPRLTGKSPIKVAALAVLIEGPGHGWDVAHRVNMVMGPSWRVEGKRIYAPLSQLASEGLVRIEQEPCPEPPGYRKIYFATELAQPALKNWLTTPPAMSIVRADIHARVACSSEADIPALLRSLKEYRIDLLESAEENAMPERPAVSWAGLVISLVRRAADQRYAAELEWVGDTCRALEGWLAKRPAR